MYAHWRSDDDSATGLDMGVVGGEAGVLAFEDALRMLRISLSLGSATYEM